MGKSKKVMDLILDIAKKDKRVYGVILSGSRSMPNATRDIFSDFDIIYLVENIKEIIEEEGWFLKFGEVLITQDSFDQLDQKVDLSRSFIKMMQFKDGSRIDLTLFNKNKVDSLKVDSFTEILLDKDGYAKKISIPKEESFLIKKPEKNEYNAVINEFLWVSVYVAKGLWRRELPYAKKIYEDPFRGSLEKMIGWFIGEKTNYKVSIGKYYRYLEKNLPSNLWIDYQKTYVGGSYTDIWEGLILSILFFSEIAKEVSRSNKFDFDEKQLENVLTYLKNIRSLPRNAERIVPKE